MYPLLVLQELDLLKFDLGTDAWTLALTNWILSSSYEVTDIEESPQTDFSESRVAWKLKFGKNDPVFMRGTQVLQQHLVSTPAQQNALCADEGPFEVNKRLRLQIMHTHAHSHNHCVSQSHRPNHWQ